MTTPWRSRNPAEPRGAGRRTAENRGRRAEFFAALILTAKGYRVLARRVRTPRGELDLIARKDGLIVFVEVKFRRTNTALEIAYGQQKRVRAAAEAWLSTRRRLEPMGVRFDAFFVFPVGFRHVRDAWRD